MKSKQWKKPTKVHIGGVHYKIRYVIPSKGKLIEEGQLGAIDQCLQLIEIDKELSKQMTLLVVLHEICHGIGDCMNPNGGPFKKEDFTATVAELMLQALQSSRLLVK